MYKYALLFAKCNTSARLEDRFHEHLRIVKYNYRDASSPIFAKKHDLFTVFPFTKAALKVGSLSQLGFFAPMGSTNLFH